MTKVSAFASQFRNGDTLKEYLGHVRLALRIMRRPMVAPKDSMSQLLRGARKDKRRTEVPRLRRAQVFSLVQAAAGKGNYDAARFFILARGFLFRVTNELFPLQRNRDGALGRSSTAWHSSISFRKNQVEISLRARKNCPEGALLVRKCSCATAPDIWCCVCALRHQVQASRDRGFGPLDSIWPFSQNEIEKLFKDLCLELGVGSPGWHAFRRGMASDMLDNGDPLSLILRAGGWRSAAFLVYLSRSSLDKREATEFAFNDSDSEGEA